jgi:hypothetical protein
LRPKPHIHTPLLILYIHTIYTLHSLTPLSLHTYFLSHSRVQHSLSLTAVTYPTLNLKHIPVFIHSNIFIHTFTHLSFITHSSSLYNNTFTYSFHIIHSFTPKIFLAHNTHPPYHLLILKILHINSFYLQNISGNSKHTTYIVNICSHISATFIIEYTDSDSLFIRSIYALVYFHNTPSGKYYQTRVEAEACSSCWEKLKFEVG